MELADLGLGSYNHNTDPNNCHAYLPVQVGENRNRKAYFVCMTENEKIAQGSYLVWEGIYSLYFE